MIWLTSDTHFGHDKDFIYSPRGFRNVAEMDKTLIENWNKVIKPNDTVYHLGDLMLGDNQNGLKCLNQLNGHINIILGNHDSANRAKLYSAVLGSKADILGYATLLKYKGYIFYLSHYPTITSNNDIDKPLKAKIINLCGHTHQQENFYDNIPTIYHVGVDSHNNTPVALDTIIEDIQLKHKEIEGE